MLKTPTHVAKESANSVPRSELAARPRVVAAADAPPGISAAALRRRQVPLAVVMVSLTTLTLWSLGQAIVVTPTN